MVQTVRSLIQQYDAEAAIGPDYPHADFDAFVAFVAFHPWVFPAGSALPHKARALFATANTPPSRWVLTDERTPSGKMMFRCGMCGCETPSPPVACRPAWSTLPTCTDALAAWGWDVDGSGAVV